MVGWRKRPRLATVSLHEVDWPSTSKTNRPSPNVADQRRRPNVTVADQGRRWPRVAVADRWCRWPSRLTTVFHVSGRWRRTAGSSQPTDQQLTMTRADADYDRWRWL